MNDHRDDDLTPPPERPMTEPGRARVRAEIVAAAGAARRPDHRWVVPLAAAAALLAVVAATGLALTRAGGSGSEGAPATATTGSPTPTPTPEETPTEVPTETPSPTVSETQAAAPPDPCAQELRQVLRGAELQTRFDDRDGKVGFYVAGDRYALCDVSRGRATVHAPQPIAPAPPWTDLASFRVSTGVIDAARGTYVTRFVGGGILPAGVDSILYTFPDGHQEDADVARSGGSTWWRMVYVARDGVITEPGTNQLTLDPIAVHLDGPGGPHDFTLRWALDTCAQVNHGC